MPRLALALAWCGGGRVCNFVAGFFSVATWKLNSDDARREKLPMRRYIVHTVAFAAVAWSFAGPVATQMYAFDPKHPPANATANVYFGSTKDARGNFLSGVTVQLEIDLVTYVMVTDDAGRFKLEVPKEVLPSMVKFLCSKPGYSQVRATKRPPPDKSASPIQADCVLGRTNGSAR